MAHKQEPLRFGVIGCGVMAERVHVPNMLAVDGAQTVAYCDLDESRASLLLNQFGGEYATTDVRRILDDRTIDGVLIMIGPAVHARMVQEAAAAGKHIFVEKPIAIELEDARDAVKAVEAAQVKFLHGTCYRLAPLVQRAKQMCPTPLYSFCQCADSITHQAVHNLDLAVNLFHQAPLVSVYASGREGWGIKEDAHLPIDSFSAVLTFADGSTHTYLQHGASYNSVLSKFNYQLFDGERCVYLANRFKEVHEMKDRDHVERSWHFSGSDMDRGPQGYMGHFEELQHLVDAIRYDTPCIMTVQDAAYVLAAEKAILQSAVTKERIDFSEFLKHNDMDLLSVGRV